MSAEVAQPSSTWVTEEDDHDDHDDERVWSLLVLE